MNHAAGAGGGSSPPTAWIVIDAWLPSGRSTRAYAVVLGARSPAQSAPSSVTGARSIGQPKTSRPQCMYVSESLHINAETSPVWPSYAAGTPITASRKWPSRLCVASGSSEWKSTS